MERGSRIVSVAPCGVEIPSIGCKPGCRNCMFIVVVVVVVVVVLVVTRLRVPPAVR